jgi:hypothetical protein
MYNIIVLQIIFSLLCFIAKLVGTFSLNISIQIYITDQH